ncbi:MAG: hypothetical protein LC112_04585 [Flavobacteriales bacterium]|nr:hypothetical protein [Flavobacteriales bacterium]
MKKLVTFFSVCMLVFSSFSFGQSSKQIAKSYSVEIPKELKSQFSVADYVKTPKEFTVISEKEGMTIIFDKYKKMVSIDLSSQKYDVYSKLGYNPLESESNGTANKAVPACAKGCEDKPTDWGVALCLYNCAYEAIFG